MGEQRSDRDIERIARLGRNEALYREVNDQIDALNDIGARRETFDVVCECADLACTESFAVRRGLYEAVRSESNRFLVMPGHVVEDVESELARYDDFLVIVKDPGFPERVAEELDRRA